MKKKNVLFFLPSTTGGAERMTINIAKMLPKDEYKVTFVIVHPTMGTIMDFIPIGYEVKHIPVRNIYCATTLRMMRMIQKEKADIVFSSVLYLNARLIVAAKICGAKVIVRNNIDLSRTRSKINVRLVKFTYRWANKVIAQQEEMHDEIISYTGLPEDRVLTLHNPLDTDLINDKSSVPSPYVDNGSQIKYVWVARFSKEKGQDLAVKALEIVRGTLPNAHLYLVGLYNWNNAYDASVKKYVEDHNLSKNIHFVGFDNNPYRWVKNSECYVMPSRLEGLPNSLIDAMFLGKPVVATKCIPVIERIVKEGYNGYLAETENAKSIADGMIKALQLRQFTMTYKPAVKEDFIRLFQ